MAKKTTSKGRLGSRSMALLLTVAASVVASEGLDTVNKKDFMQNKPGADGKTAKTPMKKLALNGAVTLGAGVAAVMLDNQFAVAALTGIASGAAPKLVANVSEGMAGLGRAGGYVSIYDKAPSNVPLRGKELPLQ